MILIVYHPTRQVHVRNMLIAAHETGTLACICIHFLHIRVLVDLI